MLTSPLNTQSLLLVNSTWFVASCYTSAFLLAVSLRQTASYVIVLRVINVTDIKWQWVYRQHHFWWAVLCFLCYGDDVQIFQNSVTQPLNKVSLDWCSCTAVSFFVLNTRRKSCFSELQLQTQGGKVWEILIKCFFLGKLFSKMLTFMENLWKFLL